MDHFIKDDSFKNNDILVNKFWGPNSNVINKIKKYCDQHNFSKIIDIGAGYMPFALANYIIDSDDTYSHLYKNSILNKININYEPFLYIDKFFDYGYSRHTLEDISNPYFAFNEIIRVSKRGYIETPSPLIESLKGVDGGTSPLHRGYIHHRYIVWSDKETNTLYFLPKMPIIEYTKILDQIETKLIYLANNFPLLWNNYYIYNEDLQPNIIVYGHNTNDNLFLDNTIYGNLILSGIEKSIEYSNHYFSDCM